MAIFALYPQVGFRASPHAHDERPASLYYALFLQPLFTAASSTPKINNNINDK